jgi:hypothetical protein
MVPAAEVTPAVVWRPDVLQRPERLKRQRGPLQLGDAALKCLDPFFLSHGLPSGSAEVARDAATAVRLEHDAARPVEVNLSHVAKASRNVLAFRWCNLRYFWHVAAGEH